MNDLYVTWERNQTSAMLHDGMMMHQKRYFGATTSPFPPLYHSLLKKKKKIKKIKLATVGKYYYISNKISTKKYLD